MSYSDFLEDEIQDHVFNNGAYTAPANLFVALYTADPSDAGGGTEVTGGSYARVSTAAADWDTSSGGVIDNVNAITFPTATASWGTVTAFGLFDASSAGNLLIWAGLTTDKSVGDGDTASFAVGALTSTLS